MGQDESRGRGGRASRGRGSADGSRRERWDGNRSLVAIDCGMQYDPRCMPSARSSPLTGRKSALEICLPSLASPALCDVCWPSLSVQAPRDELLRRAVPGNNARRSTCRNPWSAPPPSSSPDLMTADGGMGTTLQSAPFDLPLNSLLWSVLLVDPWGRD